ncbi:universal stress protein [Vibrio sp. 03-59-1]|uniref:universal stress protein n=1 Tax=Vibrio sp. 03-59-1 TaxID=2607607 RepID=UPI0014939709|nr:universal stress protein [Vibrio sp. 03-59-1]NOH82615.1 universal stress protein [Vibrio sp. 03-59-1]
MLFKQLLVPVAPEQKITSSLNNILNIADECESKITLLMVIEDMDELKEISQYSVKTLDILDKVTKIYYSQLRTLVSELKGKYKNIDFNVQVRIGIPFIEIIQCARSEGSDFIVIDSHRKSKSHACQRGSTTLHLMRKSEIPIWSTTRELHSSKKILAAIDLDEQVSADLCKRILNSAYDLCKATNSELVLCHIWELESEGFLRKWSGYNDTDIAILKEKMKIERARKMRTLIDNLVDNNNSVNVHIELIQGHAKELLPTFIEQNSIDVTFLGSMSRTGIAGYLMGNKAEYWLNKLNATVVTLKPSEFISPIVSTTR